ncbi:hypothetical protein E1A91_D05G044100v1, partial [Gossypium mustelinum]
QPYVSELLSFTLDRLHKDIRKEPELLRVDTERIQRQMLEVAVGNYRAFISAADALVAIKEEVPSINKHLESMIIVIPNLTSGCTEFVESAEHILEKRKMNQTLLANHRVFGEYEMRLQFLRCRETTVLNIFSRNMKTALVLDSHRWVPLPAVGFSATSISLSYGTAPVAVLINSVSVALNELRACALVSLKKVLAQELIKGLHLDAQRKRVAFPHSATCFGRCYPGGAALIMDAKNLYDGFGRLSTIASLKEPSKPVSNVEEKTTSENGDFRQAVMENGVEPTGTIDETRISNADEKEIEQSHFAD